MKQPLFAVILPALLLVQCALRADERIPASPDYGLVDDLTVPDGEAGAASTKTVLSALVKAYPGRIGSVEIRNGDWSVVVNGATFYWAEGRLLPLELADEESKFSAYSFRPNPAAMPPLRVLSVEETERMKARIDGREAKQDSRYPGFMSSLWGMDSFPLAEETVVRVDFLGSNIRIHPDIQEPLNRVEMEILKTAQTDVGVSRWLGQLSEVGAYVWRDIAGSANRSLHSYGIAIDLVPKNYGGKQAYWRWARDFYEEWWAIPYQDRYQIPPPVVQAFEDNGFIWGGKWMLFDQIHFEYRPELIVLGGSQSK